MGIPRTVFAIPEEQSKVGSVQVVRRPLVVLDLARA